MITKKKFLKRVDDFRELTGISDFLIGQRAVNDNKIIGRIRDGADLRTETMDKIDAWMKKEKRKWHAQNA